MLELLIQFFGEFMLQAVGEVLLELGLHALAEPFRKTANPWLASVGYAIFGAVFGGLSLLAFPAGVGAWRARRGESLFRIDRFSYGFLFAGSLAAIRFKYAT